MRIGVIARYFPETWRDARVSPDMSCYLNFAPAALGTNPRRTTRPGMPKTTRVHVVFVSAQIQDSIVRLSRCFDGLSKLDAGDRGPLLNLLSPG
jgi:hypothetical protein